MREIESGREEEGAENERIESEMKLAKEKKKKKENFGNENWIFIYLLIEILFNYSNFFFAFILPKGKVFFFFFNLISKAFHAVFLQEDNCKIFFF